LNRIFDGLEEAKVFGFRCVDPRRPHSRPPGGQGLTVLVVRSGASARTGQGCAPPRGARATHRPSPAPTIRGKSSCRRPISEVAHHSWTLALSRAFPFGRTALGVLPQRDVAHRAAIQGCSCRPRAGSRSGGRSGPWGWPTPRESPQQGLAPHLFGQGWVPPRRPLHRLVLVVGEFAEALGVRGWGRRLPGAGSAGLRGAFRGHGLTLPRGAGAFLAESGRPATVVLSLAFVPALRQPNGLKHFVIAFPRMVAEDPEQIERCP
jgi:hypothetical protein